MNDDDLLLFVIGGAALILLWPNAALANTSSGQQGQSGQTGGQSSGQHSYGFQQLTTQHSQSGGQSASISHDADILARTIYGEARGEGTDGMEAVAFVVMNRVNADTFPGGSSVAGVCQAPLQFSCWNSNDPNLSIIQNVTTNNQIFAECVSIAQQAINGTLGDDITNGATSYRANYWVAQHGNPRGLTQVAQIGNQTFYV